MWSLKDQARSEKVEPLGAHDPSSGGMRPRATFLFQLPGRKPVCSPWSIYCHVFRISVLLLVTSLLRTAPKHGAAALSGVPKGKTAVLCSREGTRVLEKLGSGMS